MTATFPALRLRRLRQHPILRDLIRETELNLNDLILPLFIKNETGEKQAISSMPGHFQIPISALEEEIKEITALGINSILLFGVPDHKDAMGTGGYHEDGIVQKAIGKIRSLVPNLLIMTDVCFCQYADHLIHFL